MAGETWPATLPQHPLRNSYSTMKGDGRVITPMEQGAPRARRLYANVPRSFSAKYAMTLAQWSTFNTFWDSTLVGGTLTVNLPLRTPAGSATVEVLIVDLGQENITGPDQVEFTIKAVAA